MMNQCKGTRIPEIRVLGCAAVVISGILLEDWKKVFADHPEAVVCDEQGETVFRALTEAGPGYLHDDRIVFSTFPTAEGYACATIVIDPEAEDKTEVIERRLGTGLLNLMEMEYYLEKALKKNEFPGSFTRNGDWLIKPEHDAVIKCLVRSRINVL